jgi:hypothetical protein
MPLHATGFLARSDNESPCTSNEDFLNVLVSFQREANEIFPALQWMPLHSLHCTVRGIQ